jgi:tetratricopeptide (TPR) repeat protein
MRALLIAAASILGILLIGCSTNSSAQQAVQQAALEAKAPDADALPAKPPPFNAETRFAAGQVDEAQHNLGSAVTQYEEALKINPKHLGSLYRLGVIYAELKQYPTAIAYWQRYLQASGNAATAYADLGFCQELAAQPDQAEASYQAGIARDGKCVPCRVNYGLMLARHGRIADAIEQWQAVLTPAEVHYNLGGIYAAQGNKAKARVEFNKALELDPNLNDAKLRVSALDSN